MSPFCPPCQSTAAEPGGRHSWPGPQGSVLARSEVSPEIQRVWMSGRWWVRAVVRVPGRGAHRIKPWLSNFEVRREPPGRMESRVRTSRVVKLVES